MSSEKKQWSNEEDELLRHFRQELKIGNWSLIAQKMAEEHNIIGRSGKQCRERYHNYLDKSIGKSGWTKEEELQLFKLHDQKGNKWALIAKQIAGRTDNCVKNHFYSKLRKSLRKLNKIIHDNFKKQYKEIKINTLYKIIEANEERHKQNAMIDEQFYNNALSLKNKLLHFADDIQANTWETNPDSCQKIIHNLYEFNKNYKRQPKKMRKNSLELLEVPSSLRPRIKSSSTNNNQSQQELDGSFVFSDCSDRKQQSVDEQQVSIQKVPTVRTVEIKIEQQPTGDIQNELYNHGLVEHEPMPLLFMNRDVSRNSKISVERDHQQNMFFDDTQLHIKLCGFNPFGNVKKCSEAEHDYYHNDGI